MKTRWVMAFFSSALLAGCASGLAPASREAQVAQVREAELAFAKTMADRDHGAFLDFVAEDAVFLNGGKPLRGKAAIGKAWQRYYAGPRAPFGWKPDAVEVVGSGGLAQTAGPVTGADGKVFARFHSTWRLDPDGRWRVVFDDGSAVCDCPAK